MQTDSAMPDAHEFLSAIVAGDTDAARAMLRESPSLAATAVPSDAPEQLPRGRSALQLAIEHCGDDFALEVLVAGADPEHRDPCGRGAIHDAFEYGTHDTFERLVQDGAFVDAAIAAGMGDLDRLRELVESDRALAGDLTTGLEPMGWASYGERPEVLRYLHGLGESVRTAHLSMASSCGHERAVETLLELGAEPDGATGHPLHETARMRFSECTSACAEALIRAGADPDRRDPEGLTPVEIARARLARAPAKSTEGAELKRLLALFGAESAS